MRAHRGGNGNGPTESTHEPPPVAVLQVGDEPGGPALVGHRGGADVDPGRHRSTGWPAQSVEATDGIEPERGGAHRGTVRRTRDTNPALTSRGAFDAHDARHWGKKNAGSPSAMIASMRAFTAADESLWVRM